jgi:hypothetical protein
VPGSRTSSRAGPGRHDRPRDSPLPLAWLRSSNGTLQCEPGNAATRRSLTGTPKQLSPFSRSGQLAERPVSRVIIPAVPVARAWSKRVPARPGQ